MLRQFSKKFWQRCCTAIKVLRISGPFRVQWDDTVETIDGAGRGKGLLRSNLVSWASGGGGRGKEGALGPSWPAKAKNSMFLDFFEKNSKFFVFSGKKLVLAPPPWKNFALPCKTSADTHVQFFTLFTSPRQIRNLSLRHQNEILKTSEGKP